MVTCNFSSWVIPFPSMTTILPPPRSYYVVSWVPRALPEVVHLIKKIPSDVERQYISYHYELGMLVMRRCGVQNPEEIKCLLDGFREGTTRLNLNKTSSSVLNNNDFDNIYRANLNASASAASATTSVVAPTNPIYSNRRNQSKTFTNLTESPPERRKLLIFFNDYRASRPWVLCPARHCIKSARTTGKVKGRIKVYQYDPRTSSVRIPKLFFDCLSNFLTPDCYVYATFCPQQKYTDHELDWFETNKTTSSLQRTKDVYSDYIDQNEMKNTQMWHLEDFLIFSNSQAKIVAVFKKKVPPKACHEENSWLAHHKKSEFQRMKPSNLFSKCKFTKSNSKCFPVVYTQEKRTGHESFPAEEHPCSDYTDPEQVLVSIMSRVLTRLETSAVESTRRVKYKRIDPKFCIDSTLTKCGSNICSVQNTLKRDPSLYSSSNNNNVILYHDLIHKFLSRLAYGLDNPPSPQKRIPDTVKRVVTKIVADGIQDVNIALINSSALRHEINNENPSKKLLLTPVDVKPINLQDYTVVSSFENFLPAKSTRSDTTPLFCSYDFNRSSLKQDSSMKNMYMPTTVSSVSVASTGTAGSIASAVISNSSTESLGDASNYSPYYNTFDGNVRYVVGASPSSQQRSSPLTDYIRKDQNCILNSSSDTESKNLYPSSQMLELTTTSTLNDTEENPFSLNTSNFHTPTSPKLSTSPSNAYNSLFVDSQFEYDNKSRKRSYTGMLKNESRKRRAT